MIKPQHLRKCGEAVKLVFPLTYRAFNVGGTLEFDIVDRTGEPVASTHNESAAEIFVTLAKQSHCLPRVANVRLHAPVASNGSASSDHSPSRNVRHAHMDQPKIQIRAPLFELYQMVTLHWNGQELSAQIVQRWERDGLWG